MAETTEETVTEEDHPDQSPHQEEVAEETTTDHPEDQVATVIVTEITEVAEDMGLDQDQMMLAIQEREELAAAEVTTEEEVAEMQATPLKMIEETAAIEITEVPLTPQETR